MKILAFLCNWCSYEASMQAGGKRLPLPGDVAFIRVMCSGMIDPQAVLAAFAEGADGVMILGCHPGDCHYREGNYHAYRRASLMPGLLDQWGIDTRRFMIDWASASEGDRFAKLVNEFHARIVELGPLPQRDPGYGADGAPPEAWAERIREAVETKSVGAETAPGPLETVPPDNPDSKHSR